MSDNEELVENGIVQSMSDRDMLHAWRKYTNNPTALYPCENFKAGWRMNEQNHLQSTEVTDHAD